MSSPLLSPAEADALIRGHVQALPTESLPLAQAVGAVLRDSVFAERDEPPFDRVTMDGIALDSRARGRRLRVEGTQMAGDPPLSLSSPDGCIEVMTGAMLPAGCDCVVPYEEISIEAGTAELGPGARLGPFLNVHRRGSETLQDARLLCPGMSLGSAELALAATAGLAHVQVAAQPRIAVLSTGNELIEPGEPILPHQVRRSNAYALRAMLQRQGFTRLADEHLADEENELLQRLRYHLHTHDVVVLSGGVSAGKADLVPRTLEALGVQRIFHKLAQRPGKPLWFGVAPSGTMVFGLPGNPVSSSVSLVRYVLPAIRLAQGWEGPPLRQLALAAPVTPHAALTNFVPVKLELDAESRLWAVLKPTHGSGDFFSLAGTDGFVEIPPGTQGLPRGARVPLYPW